MHLRGQKCHYKTVKETLLVYSGIFRRMMPVLHMCWHFLWACEDLLDTIIDRTLKFLSPVNVTSAAWIHVAYFVCGPVYLQWNYFFRAFQYPRSFTRVYRIFTWTCPGWVLHASYRDVELAECQGTVSHSGSLKLFTEGFIWQRKNTGCYYIQLWL